jgi:hypothetical protein
MHTKPMGESEGTMRDGWKPDADCACRDCGRTGAVECRVWESSCGGYEDEKYRCAPDRGGCGATWWVDGIDS